MSSRTKKHERSPALYPDYLIFCEQVLWSHSRDISYVTLVNTLTVPTLPFELERFWLVASFLKDPSITVEEFNRHRVLHTVVLESPNKNQIELGKFPATEEEGKGSMLYRLIIDFSHNLTLLSDGVYKFRILEEFEGREPVPVLQMILPVFHAPETKDTEVIGMPRKRSRRASATAKSR